MSAPTGFAGWMSDWFGITIRQDDRVDAWQQYESDLDSMAKAEDILHGLTYPGRLAPAAMDFRLAKRMNLNPQRSYTVLNLVMMFFIFCFVGWVWEVTLASSPKACSSTEAPCMARGCRSTAPAASSSCSC